MTRQRKLSLTARIVAAILTVFWISAGIFVVAIGILQKRWLVILLGPPAIWYGLVWMRVAREGRRHRWPEGWIPWRRG